MLNEVQQHIANHTECQVCVIAGPVSGKTKPLVDRIVNFVKKGIDSEAIMVGTYTEKAAKERNPRISNKLLKDGIRFYHKEIYVGTLHSIFLRFLEENREYTRLKHSYRLFDQLEQIFMMFGKQAKERLVM
jgi:DNA helicase-2/ATP-dependent DNA helicase PcrA